MLASGSPRRRDLLEAAGLCLQVCPGDADETWPEAASLADAIIEVSRRKLVHLPDSTPLALAADTIVARDAAVLGKPEDASAARAMLRSLSGRSHQVITGFVLQAHGPHGDVHEIAEAVSTTVRFRALSDADIARYVATGDCMDKAGAYGIQSLGGCLVDTVMGSYTNIVGLPLKEVLGAIDKLLPHLSASAWPQGPRT